MRKNLNKKGFTLIELLAVIVVLAVIMVIATQQVNRAIKKSRGEAFLETAQSVRKSMQTVCAMDNAITKDTLEAQVDNAEAIDIEIVASSDTTSGKVNVKAKAGKKFINRIDPDIDTSSPVQLVGTKDDNGAYYTFDAECPAS